MLSKKLNPFYLYERRNRLKPAVKARYRRFRNLLMLPFISWGVFLSANERKVASLKDIHKGRRCFIIGNGPSLTIEDLDLLKNEITFACNKIYLAFTKTEWRPTYYSVLDVLVAENNANSINELQLCKIYHEDVRPYFPAADDIIWLNALTEPKVEGEFVGMFSDNALKGVYGGWTVLYPQIQIAFFMGIREMYLLGVDFNFEVPTSSGKTCQHGEIVIHKGEKNHFHPEYRKPGETWTLPQLDLQRKAFSAAKMAIEAQGGCIYNASRKTALDVFPTADFNSIIKQNTAPSVFEGRQQKQEGRFGRK